MRKAAMPATTINVHASAVAQQRPGSGSSAARRAAEAQAQARQQQAQREQLRKVINITASCRAGDMFLGQPVQQAAPSADSALTAALQEQAASVRRSPRNAGKSGSGSTSAAPSPVESHEGSQQTRVLLSMSPAQQMSRLEITEGKWRHKPLLFLAALVHNK